MNSPTRRTFLQSSLAVVATGLCPALAAAADKKAAGDDLKGKLGITTGSFMRHLTVHPRKGKMRLLDVPRIMRDELDLQVLDLMTATLASFKPAYLDELRSRAEKAGCIITNLKMNQKGLDMASPDRQTRRRALGVYKQTIDSAHRLGCRWVRPNPGGKRPDIKRLADSYQELIDYARPKGITLLIENNGWMRDDPAAIPTVIRAVGKGLAASVDTGNWTDRARFAGLAKAYPLAVTCDFKAYMFQPGGKHPRYDLKKCFDIGHQAGFRGPWCFEHFNETLAGLLSGFARLRDLLRAWHKQS